jgi:hypothetical protein
MHRYRIVTRISLILFILNLVLAAPAIVQEIHEARGDEMVVVEPSHDDVAETTQDDVAEASHGGVAEPSRDDVAETTQDNVAEASHDGVAETSPDGAAEASQEAMASPQHSPDGSTSSGYPTPHVPSGSSESGYSWMLDRPPRLSPHDPLPQLTLDEPPTETHPDDSDAEFFNADMMTKIKVLAAATVIGSAVAGIVGASLSKDHKQRDFEDSST